MQLICYLSNGYPSIDASVDMADTYIRAGCDIIEVDFPSRNPYLESEYIAGRMAEALKVCDDYDEYMKGMLRIKKRHPDIRFIVLAYENTVVEIGVDKYAKFLLDHGFEDIIYVGAEHEAVKAQLIEKGIRVSCYVQFHMPDDEVAAAKAANGFVYMQAKPTTGNVNEKHPTLKSCITRLRREGIDREIYAGVGISTADDVRMARDAGADAVFVGSRILKLHDDIPALKEAIAELKAATKA